MVRSSDTLVSPSSSWNHPPPISPYHSITRVLVTTLLSKRSVSCLLESAVLKTTCVGFALPGLYSTILIIVEYLGLFNVSLSLPLSLFFFHPPLFFVLVSSAYSCFIYSYLYFFTFSPFSRFLSASHFVLSASSMSTLCRRLDSVGNQS